ncbi:lysozyme inhibitor LprI family protein [Kordia periserrulae]|nr:lysozyme inhibitor LprI family protein [Kordia periserrulae]
MKKIFSLLVVLMTNFCFSQTTADTIDQENRRCLQESTPGTLESVECDRAASASWKELLEQTLVQLRDHPEIIAEDALFDSQTHWVRYQEADLEFYTAFYHQQYEGDTMTQTVIANHEKQQFRKRTMYLLEFLEILNEQ